MVVQNRFSIAVSTCLGENNCDRIRFVSTDLVTSILTWGLYHCFSELSQGHFNGQVRSGNKDAHMLHDVVWTMIHEFHDMKWPSCATWFRFSLFYLPLPWWAALFYETIKSYFWSWVDSIFIHCCHSLGIE